MGFGYYQGFMSVTGGEKIREGKGRYVPSTMESSGRAPESTSSSRPSASCERPRERAKYPSREAAGAPP
jgi:hypothetical protein